MTGLATGFAGGVLAIVVGNVDGVLETIVLVGAAVAALGVIRVKVCKPAIAFAGRVDDVLDDLRGLPKLDARLGAVERKVDAIIEGQTHYEGRLAGMEGSLGSLAATERRSIEQLLKP